ncbi:hypothetical protein HWC35_gp140 [Vibrio phage USC-1]|uniref:Uncharacterized protein n=2 Tax=Aphroditevirus USC1 TaxID=2846605 RepID=A0A514A2M8_9CAUD|nr:hypothetical protein HWC35_gp140 [Vibrio phage USC-1]QCW23195.1 hypothetical protein [Vibrio phage 5 TSL-2019]QDH47534.1 hypothetical protein [Vibrio phage USC-1]
MVKAVELSANTEITRTGFLRGRRTQPASLGLASLGGV